MVVGFWAGNQGLRLPRKVTRQWKFKREWERLFKAFWNCGKEFAAFSSLIFDVIRYTFVMALL